MRNNANNVVRKKKDKKELEKYSVIMSIYNKVKCEHIEESINSILNQTYKPDEFILIKDGKLTKEQEELIDDIVKKNKKLFKVFEYAKNMGAGFAYNKGIEMCTNKWAAIMDSDDFAVNTKFEKQMRYLSEHDDIDAIGTNAVEFLGSKDNIISKRIMPETNEEIIKFGHGRCPLIQPTVIFKVDSVKKAGSYQHSPLTEDFDLYIRMIMNGCKFYTYQEILFYVRTSGDFFKRRGGLKYLKPILSFKYRYYKIGYFTLMQFLKTACSSAIVSLMPNKIRTIVYKKFLRN